MIVIQHPAWQPAFAVCATPVFVFFAFRCARKKEWFGFGAFGVITLVLVLFLIPSLVTDRVVVDDQQLVVQGLFSENHYPFGGLQRATWEHRRDSDGDGKWTLKFHYEDEVQVVRGNQLLDEEMSKVDAALKKRGIVATQSL